MADDDRKAPDTGDQRQDERLEQSLEHAREHTEAMDQEWAAGADEVRKLEGDPPASKDDFPDDEPGDKAQFETFAGGEEAPPGSPEHDRGSISGP